MAEVVERNIEDSLNEIVHIRRTKLFSEDEIREITRLRRQHEYSIQKRNKKISDYESYISLELGVLKLVKIRRQKVNDFRFKDEIEKSIISRLVRLHRQTCYRFQAHLDVWIRFLHFNRKLGRHVAISRLWQRVLQVHGRTDARLWAAAAAYQVDEGARAQARSILSKLKSECQALKNAMRKVKRLRKSPTCPQENVALRLEMVQLEKLRESLQHSVHLTWDRAQLHGIREARRLLTQGLAFNETSTPLLLELLKLEGAAADFFVRRVAERRMMAEGGEGPGVGEGEDEEMPEEKETSSSNRVPRWKKKFEGKRKAEKNDAIAFMNEVTEDVDFVKSGGTFNLVLERFLTFPSATSSDLAAALEVTKKLLPYADKGLVKKLTDRKNDLAAQEVAEEKLKLELAKKKAQSPTSLLESMVEAAETHTNEFRRLLDTSGVDEALSAWRSWYPHRQQQQQHSIAPAHKSPPGSEATAEESLRSVADPSADPRWMSLLTARLYALVVAKMLFKREAMTLAAEPEAAVKAYQEFRLKQEDRINETRALMDSLATSNWGSKVPDFWRLYMEFEEKVGDCSRVPSLRWRAEKCLAEAPRAKFFADLVAADQKRSKELL